MLHKMKLYGQDSKTLKWTKDFLKDRQMRVTVRANSSGWTKVNSGVPQESVQGPLLFLLFVNDFPRWIKNSIKMFADDTKIENMG